MASTSRTPKTTPDSMSSIGVQWLILNPPFKLGIEQVGTGAKARVRNESPVNPETPDIVFKTSKANDDAKENIDPQLTGTWSTVELEKARYAESAQRKASNSSTSDPDSRRALEYLHRSNVVVDLWWPSKFLEPGVVRDEGEQMPPLSWRDRILLGNAVLEEYSPAFWREITVGMHER